MIVIYRGSRGKGKTLTMVKDAYNLHLHGFRIISNLSLSFGERMKSSDVLNIDHLSEIRDCVLVIDEIELFFDSRNFSKNENKQFSQFLQQIRKRNVIVLCTTQYINLVDIRIRQQLDVVVYPNFDKFTNYVRVHYFNLTRLEDYNFKYDLFPTFVVFSAIPVFKLYDTKEILSI